MKQSILARASDALCGFVGQVSSACLLCLIVLGCDEPTVAPGMDVPTRDAVVATDVASRDRPEVISSLDVVDASFVDAVQSDAPDSAPPQRRFFANGRADFLFYINDLGLVPWTGAALDEAAARLQVGEPHMLGVMGRPVIQIAEWEYSALRLGPNESDGAGTPRSMFPCVVARQECANPATPQEAVQRLEAYYRARRAALPANALIQSVNGHFYFQHFGAAWGADFVASEVGENVNSTQAHIAFTRGAATQYNIPWGIDMSPWYGPSIRDYSSTHPWAENSGENYGHSLSLFRRTYYASYMAGANMVEAEGGSVNFFRGETVPLVLSPLGQIGQEFFAFTQTHVDRGQPYVPVAVVLDQNQSFGLSWFDMDRAFDTFALRIEQRFTAALFESLWPGSFRVQGGDESGYMVAAPYGDTVDVLLETASRDVLAKYRVLVVTGETMSDPALADRLRPLVMNGATVITEPTASHQTLISRLVGGVAGQPLGPLPQARAEVRPLGLGRVITVNDPGAWSEALPQILPQMMPFSVNAPIEMLLNRVGDRWLLTLINNRGVTKQPRVAEVIDENQAQTVTVRPRRGSLTVIQPWRAGTNFQSTADSFTVTVGSGEVAIYEVRAPEVSE